MLLDLPTLKISRESYNLCVVNASKMARSLALEVPCLPVPSVEIKKDEILPFKQSAGLPKSGRLSRHSVDAHMTRKDRLPRLPHCLHCRVYTSRK